MNESKSKPPKKLKRPKKPYKSNVEYLAGWTGEDRFDSPIAMLQRAVDEINSGRLKSKDLILITGYGSDLEYSYTGVNPRECLSVLDLVRQAVIDDIRGDCDE